MARILVVDDEPDIREVLERILQAKGHRVDAAGTYEGALAAARAAEYDLIVTDINLGELGLGGQDGLLLLRELGPEAWEATPTIVVTGNYLDVRNPIEAVKLGVSDFLCKPIEIADFLKSVRRALLRRQATLLQRRLLSPDSHLPTSDEGPKFMGDHESGGRDENVDVLSEQVQALLRRLQDLRKQQDALIVFMAGKLEGHDETTAEHCHRLRRNCTRLAREYPEFRQEKALRDLELGAMLHDIGKYKVPEAILRKPGPLTPEEWTVMRRHPEEGALLLADFDFLQGGCEVVRNHHERWDGGGYPRGLRGEQIPLAARVFMVVDAFDTITSWRPYKQQRSREDALAEIRRCAGTHFDPSVVEVFCRVSPELEVEPPRAVAETAARR